MAAVVAGSAHAQAPAIGASADVHDTAGRLVASVDFREGRGEVLIAIRFANPPVLSGTHAVHINQMGRCDPPDFASSGAIFNPFGTKHGRRNPNGAEVGDLPNVDFSSGQASYNTSAPGASLGSGVGALLGPNRIAVVVFSGEDDQLSDPEGNAGTRIACGVITPVAAAPVAQPARSPSPAVSIKPGSVPSAVPLPPVAVKPAALPSVSPSPLVASVPTMVVAPIVLPPERVATQSTTSSTRSDAIIVGLLGLCLMVAGYLVRRPQRSAN
jgi:Cu-Zn family superoxide dismutase